MPRSLAFCFMKIDDNLGYLAADYGEQLPCHTKAAALRSSVTGRSIGSIFDEGLHEFLQRRIADTNDLAARIERDYRFYE